MGRVIWILIAPAVVTACGISAVGQSSAPPDSVIPDATAPVGPDGSSSDGGGPGDSSTAIDGGDGGAPGAKQCVTFANSIAPFQYEGDTGGYALSAQGVTLTVASGKYARLFHTFDAPAVYSRTRVDAHVGIVWESGSWGSAGSDYSTLLQQFHGASRDSAVSSRIDVTMATNIIELNIWAPNQTTRGLGGMKLPGADAHLVIDTTWASGTQGETLVSLNPTPGVASWPLANIPTIIDRPDRQAHGHARRRRRERRPEPEGHVLRRVRDLRSLTSASSVSSRSRF